MSAGARGFVALDDTYALSGWHFVEHAFNDHRQTGALSLYIDGKLEGSHARNLPIYYNGSPFYIGAGNSEGTLRV